MNKVELQGKLSRDCHVAETKSGKKMCFFTIQATRDGGSDFLPVKAFGVPETVIAALVKGADTRVLGRLQAGKYDKEKKAQLYDNIVVAEEITCAGAVWNASAATVTPVVTTAPASPTAAAAPVPATTTAPAIG